MICISATLHLRATDVAAWPFPPSLHLAMLLSSISLCTPSPKGLLSWLHTGSSLLLSLFTYMHIHNYFCRYFCSSLPTLLLAVPSWAAGAGWEEGWRELEDVHPPELLPSLGDGGQGTKGQARRVSSQRHSWKYKTAGVLPSDLSWLCSWENHVSENRWQLCWLP